MTETENMETENMGNLTMAKIIKLDRKPLYVPEDLGEITYGYRIVLETPKVTE